MLERLSVDELRQQLQDKEQTVATLTGYLEQAATKLKDLQIQSARPKPVRAFDEAMVLRQMELVKDLQAAVEEWEQLQAPATLERVSSQLDALRRILVDGFARLAPQPELPPEPGGIPPTGLSSLSFLMPAPEGDPKEEKGLKGWEALKAEMLKQEPAEAAVEEEEGHIDLQEELAVLVNRPQPTANDCNDRAVWQEAVDSREKYIISLIRALRLVESRRRGSPNWESFTEAPPALREEVAQVAAELQQSLRNAEVELSIERARISRQDSLIAQQRRELDKALKKQGYPQSASSISSSSAESTQGRWLKFLGKGNGNAES